MPGADLMSRFPILRRNATGRRGGLSSPTVRWRPRLDYLGRISPRILHCGGVPVAARPGGVGNEIGCSRRSGPYEGGCRCSSCPVLETCGMPRDSRGAPLGPRVGDGSALGSRCRRWTASNRRPGLSFNHTNASFVERMVDTNLARRASRKTFNSPRALAQRFHEPWSGDVPPGESANPGGRAMAEETPKAPEPELKIGGGEEAKAPARPRNLYGYVKKA